jgi:hypothetical protein
MENSLPILYLVVKNYHELNWIHRFVTMFSRMYHFPHPEPHQSRPRPLILLLLDPFKYYNHIYTYVLQTVSFLSGFPTKCQHSVLFSLIRVTSPSHFKPFNLFVTKFRGNGILDTSLTHSWTFPLSNYFTSHIHMLHFKSICFLLQVKYKVVQIWPGRFVCKQFTVCPGHI